MGDYTTIFGEIQEAVEEVRDWTEGFFVPCPCAKCRTERALERREKRAHDACRIFGDILSDSQLEKTMAELADDGRKCIYGRTTAPLSVTIRK